MSNEPTMPKDPRDRPADPAGTRPRHNPDDLVPKRRPATPPYEGEGLWSEHRRGHEFDGAAETRDSTIAPPGPESMAPHATADQEPDLAAVEEAAETHEPVTAASASAGKISEGTAGRIRVIVAGLIAIAIIGLGTGAILAFGPEDSTGPSGPAWSSWRPDGNANERVATIADRVGKEYRGANNSQLVVVTGGPLEVAGLPLTVALRESEANGGDVQLEGGKGVLYRLCGLGEKCSIATGTPSQERHLLLRREALELALYTLHYTDADQVVVFMPPPKGKSPDEALYFRRSDLEPQLNSPLVKSLTPRTPSVASVTKSPDARFVQSLTLQTLFKFSLTQANSDSRAFLVLDQIS